MASHHFAAGTFTEASVGPDIHAQFLALVILLTLSACCAGRLFGGS
jgi:hypothetical protein